ncbi:MAG TPA: amidohydrolase family protein [Holophagaceae bacterium]|nr:amidohydrolase family protein [Holophagaceae bacterium]
MAIEFRKLGLAALLLAAATRPAFAGVPPDDAINDSHFHIANYAMQGAHLHEFVHDYMGDKVLRSVVSGLPLQQKWDSFEQFAGGRMPPNYYMGPKAGLYYYSFIDAMIAMDYRTLSSEDKARLDPMIVGFNPMDQFGVQHIKRMLLLFPGVFEGIGEFSVHKEILSDKIDDDIAGASAASAQLPADVDGIDRNTLYNPALKTILDFAGDSGLAVLLHNDVYRATVTYQGKVLGMAPETPYTEAMEHLLKGSPKATVIWAHAGLGRFVKPSPGHLKLVSGLLDACPNLCVDLSWDLVQRYIVHPGPGMPSFAEWAAFVTKYQDRILWGSDSCMYTRNMVDEHGEPALGKQLPVADYLAVTEICRPLWDAVGPEVAHKVKITNHLRIFNSARSRVRTWEKAHAADNTWDLR